MRAKRRRCGERPIGRGLAREQKAEARKIKAAERAEAARLKSEKRAEARKEKAARKEAARAVEPVTWTCRAGGFLGAVAACRFFFA